ncbi:MAG: zinc transporter ZupT [Zhaonellaceae bacterium]|jgi:ZIP family zinc transporter|nr:zinc transporter ZupT [Clostridia bacterium]
MLNNQALFALAISFVAGMSTLLGLFVIFTTKGKNEKALTASLGFAAGVMISVSFSDLLPQAQELLISYGGNTKGVLLGVVFLIVGILLAVILDRFTPHEEFDNETRSKSHPDLFRVGFVSMLAIALHNFPEGIATFMAGYNDQSLGISIALAITLHNVPEGISVAMPIYYATGSWQKAFKFTFLSGMAEPLGALLAFLVLRPFINELVLGAIFATVAGIMIYVSLEELIPSSRQYGYKNLALFSTFAGICLMPLSHIF